MNRTAATATFHPLVEKWFAATFDGPTAPQLEGWTAISEGRDALIAAPTGSGKTLAAFLWAINGLVEAASAGRLSNETAVIYVSPLKALGNDIHKNLQVPLSEIRRLAEESGQPLPEIRLAVRSGDTPTSERAMMVRKPPHILITTPESLYILLTAERSRGFLKTARTVIVDEIHAVAGDKRGAHLALSLERLDLLAGKRLQRIGLSATQKPIEEIARLLIGSDPSNEVVIVDTGHQREWDLKVEVPSLPLGPIATHDLWAETYERITDLVKQHRTTLVFVNTRRLVERVAYALTNRLGEGKVAAHHGSLSRKIRLEAEQGLKSGETPVVVATASLELGIDIGHVDLVVHIGAPRVLATLVQRIGRSGHWLDAIPKGIVLPMTRDELVQSAAAVRAARAGELDRLIIPENPRDILAQQIAATAAAGEISEEDLFAMVRRAHNFRNLPRSEFDAVVEMLAEGVASRRGRRGALIHRDQINGVIKPRRGTRLISITCGGAIPDVADYDVIAEPDEAFVGKVNEDFAIESSAGDIFLLGNTSWRIRRVESGRVRVEDAKGLPPSIPFWIGEAPSRTRELSSAVSELRERLASMLDDREGAVAWLVETCGVDAAGAEQIFDYIAETVAVLGAVPTTDTVIAERFFDESGGMQLVVHSPFGGRINRAWGLALRKRFCVAFDFELQAAATDDGIVLSLGEQHSFPLESVFNFVRTPTLRETLLQAALQSPVFTTRWRWNTTRALVLLRHSGGRKVPAPLQRMRAEDLLAAVFPEQVACQDNNVGPITPPDHPLVNETVDNCLEEWMDIRGLAEVIGAIEQGDIKTMAVETPVPSALSHEILNSSPYTFLDDAPLEERRARAVALRRTDPELAKGVGALDQAAIDEVRAQALPDIRDADELHDHLLSVIAIPYASDHDWREWIDELRNDRRVVIATWTDQRGSSRRALVAAERAELARAALAGALLEPEPELPDRLKDRAHTAEEAVLTMTRGWMQILGPVTTAALADHLGIASNNAEAALASLEAGGEVLRGQFTPGVEDLEWCDRRLLARIHRLTVGRLRSEIEPVTPAQLMRFLLRWQHVQPGTQMHGRDGVLRSIKQLQGLEAPAPAWEEKILPARVANYDPADLEYLCLSGEVAWGRLAAGGDDWEGDEVVRPATGRRRSAPARNSPLAFVMREDLAFFVKKPPTPEEHHGALSSAAREVASLLEERGASFLTEIVKGTGRLASEAEEALWELVSAGLVSGDGIAGLRHLLKKGIEARRQNYGRLRALPGARARARPLPVGRWSLWGQQMHSVRTEERTEAIARQLLVRYGVVFRDVIGREKNTPSWRLLLNLYRRWEMQGQVRGGRFVSGFVGEQFALPEAVEALRAVRKTPDEVEPVFVSAADPLNLVGIIVPGDRVSPFQNVATAYVNGVAAEVGPIGTLRTRFWKPGDRVDSRSG